MPLALMVAAFGHCGAPGCVAMPDSALVAKRYVTVSPSLSETGIGNVQIPFCGQKTMGGMLLTGELLPEPTSTIVWMRYALSGLFMCALGAVQALRRALASIFAVLKPLVA